jgi:hypothetical protein
VICPHCHRPVWPTNAELLALLLEIKRTESFALHDLIDNPALRELFSVLSPKQVGKRFEMIAKKSLDCDGLTIVRIGDDRRHGAIWQIVLMTRV